MQTKIRRRTFLTGASAGLGLWATAPAAAIRRGPLREKLSVACIGVGGRGWANTSAMADENVIALCDPDERQLGRARELFPEAAFYPDYRALLDELADELDTVVVSTPDHMHGPISIAAMKRGLHCYCEKPLTWSIEEARVMATLAREKKLATQMGNQGTASPGFRAGVEALRAGVLGDVSEVHVWTNRPVWPQALATPADKPEVPAGLHWDAWLGCAPERDYHPAYLPFKWRGWYDFGSGALGDMACHTVNLPYMGLELGAPTRVVAESTQLFDDAFPAGSRVTYSFPARGARPALKLVWYDGEMRPAPDLRGGTELPGSGCLIVGERGTMFSPDDYGSRQEVTGEAREALEKLTEPGRRANPALFPPRSPGHHAEWLAACRGEGTPLSSFAYAGPFTEAMQLGNLAVRLGKTIEWDSAALKAKRLPEADALIRREYREGFGI